MQPCAGYISIVLETKTSNIKDNPPFVVDDFYLYTIALWVVVEILRSSCISNIFVFNFFMQQEVFINSLPPKIPNTGRRRPKKRVRRDRRNFKLMLLGDDDCFKQNFKVSKGAFYAIVQTIKDCGFYVRPRFGRGLRKDRVTCTQALGMTLIYIACGCSMRVVGMITGCARQTVQKHVRKVLKVLSSHVFHRQVKIPTGADADAVTADFLNRCGIPEIIGAIDGTHIPMLRPDIDNMDYMNRKGFYSMVFQAVAIGTTLQFIEFSGGWAGSIGDSSMFKVSSLYKMFISGRFPHYKLLADAAYGLYTWCLTPYERLVIGMPPIQYRYNFWHSSGRMVIERAFGLLKMRFPILCRPFTSTDETLVEVVLACVALHNICCVCRSEWDESFQNQWVESMRAPIGMEDYNFDNDAYERALRANRPTDAARLARDAIAENMPALPVHHRTGF